MLAPLGLVALLACAACAETTGDAPVYGPSGDRAPVATDDAPAARARFVAREPAVREPVMHEHFVRRDGDFLVCAAMK